MNPTNAQQPLFPEQGTAESSRTISTRATHAEYQRIEGMAKRAGLSVGAQIKQSALAEPPQGPSTDGLVSRLAEIENEIVDLRTDLALAVEVLLFAAGKFSPDQAKIWVQEKLNPPEP